MSDPFPRPDRPLHRAVRLKLDTDARAADAGRVLAGLRTRLDADTVSPTRGRRRSLVTAVGTMAAAVLVAVFLLIPGGSVQARPRQAVEQALETHAGPVDRCYTVRVEVPAEVRALFPRLDFDRQSRLWTRGDRYFVELPNGHGVWGRDEKNCVWFAPTADAGVQYDDREVPKVFREFLNVRAVRLLELLDELLADCDLSWADSDVKGTGPARVIRAEPRNDWRSLRAAVIEVVKDTHVVRRLALERQLFGNSKARVRVAFELVDTAPQEDDRYQPTGHLMPGAPVYDWNRRLLRAQVVLKALGPFKDDP